MVQIRDEAQRGIDYYMHLPFSILLHQIEDEGQQYWIAEVPELPGCKSHGTSVEEAVKSLEEAKKDWILDSLDKGEEVPIPVERDRFSGKTILRMSRSLHRSLSAMAEAEKLSLNQLMVTILAKEVGRLTVLNRVEDKIDRLLARVNDALEREELRTFSKSVHVIAGHLEQWQYPLASAAHTLEAPAAANTSTVSPFEELLSSHHLQRPEWRQCIIFSAGRGKEIESRDAVESKK